MLSAFDARVRRVVDLARDVRQIDLAVEGPQPFVFRPGQFVSMEIARAGLVQPITRAYSIASAPGDGRSLELLVNRVPDGTGSSYLFGLQPGDRTVFSGPAGTFCLAPHSSRALVFVATGTGIAPIRSMLLSLADAGTAVPVTLFWGLRSERDLYYQDELRRLQERMARFSFTTTLSRPAAGWRGSTETVTSLVESRVRSVANVAAYVCGNESMITDVIAVLRRKGLCPIHREQYYRDIQRAS